MKRLVFGKHCDPAEVLKIDEVQQPVPAKHELLVRMICRPINPYELALIKGNGDQASVLLQVPGFEGVGIVEATGDPSLPFKQGQRVIPTPVDLSGTWQEYVTGRPEQFIAVPDDISDTQAALILNPLTCLIVLREKLHIREGQWVLNTAASSNIGQLLIQFAGILKFKLINVVRNRAAEEQVRSLGAHHIINTTTTDLISVVEHLTKGIGVSAVIDPVGGRVGSQAVSTLGFGGKALLFSDMSGESLSLDPMELISKKLTIAGYTSLHWLNENSYAHKSTMIAELFELIRNGSLVLGSAGEYPLTDFVNAIDRSKASGRNGKIMLV